MRASYRGPGIGRTALLCLAASVALACPMTSRVSSLDRPCDSDHPCGPDAVCDPQRGRCVEPGQTPPPVRRDSALPWTEADRGAPTADRGSTPPPDGRAGGEGTCQAPLALCGTRCVNTKTDRSHCGGCDRPCGAHATCNGSCACESGYESCNGKWDDGCECTTGLCQGTTCQKPPPPCSTTTAGSCGGTTAYCGTDGKCATCVGGRKNCDQKGDCECASGSSCSGTTCVAPVQCSSADSECTSANYMKGCTGGLCFAAGCCCPTSQQCRAGSFPVCCKPGLTCKDTANGTCG
ncbi:MAG: hypothetical protein IT371_28515 [Deltaproteobacteria bacterium]|nr:hypothetical protein [Deltaproteobacteria bacterium]